MKLSAPKQITFWIALIIAILAVLATVATIPGVTDYAFWLLVIAFVILALGTLIKDF